MVLRIGAGGTIQREGDTKWSSDLGLDGAIQIEGDTKWSSELGLEGVFRERETPSGPQKGRHQVVLRIGAGGAIQREGDTKWSSEFGLEGLCRERETLSGPQNWGWRGYSERGRHQVVHRIGVGSCCE